MTLGANENYDIRINNLAGNLTASLVEAFRFWSSDIFGDSFRRDTQSVPHRHGGVAVGDGMKSSKIITVEGMCLTLLGGASSKYGGALVQIVEHLFEQLDLYADTETFLDVELRTGAGYSATRRQFAKLLDHKFIPAYGSQYTAGNVRLTFEASDPEFYDDTVAQATGAGSGHSQILAPITGTRPTQRFTVKIANTDGNALTDPTLTVGPSEVFGGDLSAWTEDNDGTWAIASSELTAIHDSGGVWNQTLTWDEAVGAVGDKYYVSLRVKSGDVSDATFGVFLRGAYYIWDKTRHEVGGGATTSNPTMTDDTWAAWLFEVLADGTVNWYVDGVLINSAAAANPTNTFRLLINPDTVGPTTNYFDDVKAWAAGDTWTVEETISGIGDYILVDHFNGTVIKNVSGTETDIIDKFNGSFFPLPAAAAVICTIGVDTGDTGVFTGTIDYWKKAGYAIA